MLGDNEGGALGTRDGATVGGSDGALLGVAEGDIDGPGDTLIQSEGSLGVMVGDVVGGTENRPACNSQAPGSDSSMRNI
jgi:hypothetical protein